MATQRPAHDDCGLRYALAEGASGDLRLPFAERRQQVVVVAGDRSLSVADEDQQTHSGPLVSVGCAIVQHRGRVVRLASVDGRLAVLGVDAIGEALYRQVLRTPGLSLASHVRELGCSDHDGEREVQQLRGHRLVRMSPDGRLSADHPRAALERVVSVEEAKLATRRQQLARLRDSIDQFATDYRVGRERSSATPPSRERVDRVVLTSMHEHLAASSVGPIRRTRLRPPDSKLSDHPTTVGQVERGRELRTLYTASALDGSGEWMQPWAQIGEQQRVVPTVPSEFVCFGVDVALATTQWGRSDGDWVILRDPMVVAAFVELFDRLWVGAAPAPDDVDGDGLLDLMRQGLKDEAIARVLGVSLRTVRRRISALMDSHGVETRFQLALKVAERDR